MTLPQKFSHQPTAVASFSFTDLITSRGILTFFAGKTADRTLLSSFVFYSNETGQQTPGGDNGTLDVDFDALLEKQLVFEGRAIVVVPLVHANNVGAGNQQVDTTLTVQLKKENVVIVSENATAAVLVGDNNQSGKVWVVDFVIPQTTFKKGDTLRITILTTAPGAANKEIILAHDPKDREMSGINSIGVTPANINQPDTRVLQALLPVRIDF